MCGRFTLRTPAKDLAEILRLADIPDLRPRYNIAPTEPVAHGSGEPQEWSPRTRHAPLGTYPVRADDPKVG